MLIEALLTCAASFAFIGCDKPNTVSAALRLIIRFRLKFVSQKKKKIAQRCYGTKTDNVSKLLGSVDSSQYEAVVRLELVLQHIPEICSIKNAPRRLNQIRR